MQAGTAAPTSQSTAPVTPVVAGGGLPSVGTDAPRTVAEMRALLARRSEIASQIGNVTDRRNEIASQLRASMPGADRSGLEARLGQMDKRIVDYEKELDVTGRQLANAKGAAANYTEQPSVPPGDLSPGQITGISIVFTIAVLMPLSIAWARAIVRRAKHASEQPSAQLTQRLDRMEEGIDAIALEVERISEGQRFVNKLLGEGAASPLVARKGGADPVVAARPEPVRIERGG